MNQRILITGATSPLGDALISAFSKRGGCQFILHGRSSEKLKVLEAKYSGLIEGTIRVDVLNEAVDDFLDDHYHWALPDIVIHAIGGAVKGDGHPLSVKALEQAVKINCFLPVSLSEGLIRRWQALKQDELNPLTIVNISSAATHLGNAAPAYVMAKSALEGWTKNLAGFYSDPKLTVFAVQPGPLLAEQGHWMQAKAQQTEAYRQKLTIRQHRPLPWVEETASEIVQLVSNSPHLFHGQIINMSGSLLT